MHTYTWLVREHSRFINRQLFKAWQRKPPYQDGLLGKTHKLFGSPMIQPWVEDIYGKRPLLDDMIGLRLRLSRPTVRPVSLSIIL